MTPARSILRGELDRFSLPTLLTILDMEKRGGLLILQNGKQLGRLFLREGRVIRAQIEAQSRESGVEAVMRLLGWSRGVFELWQTDIIGPDEIQKPTLFLLMEAARRFDEVQNVATSGKNPELSPADVSGSNWSFGALGPA